jgi:hypothetical protein
MRTQGEIGNQVTNFMGRSPPREADSRLDSQEIVRIL